MTPDDVCYCCGAVINIRRHAHVVLVPGVGSGRGVSGGRDGGAARQLGRLIYSRRTWDARRQSGAVVPWMDYLTVICQALYALDRGRRKLLDLATVHRGTVPCRRWVYRLFVLLVPFLRFLDTISRNGGVRRSHNLLLFSRGKANVAKIGCEFGLCLNVSKCDLVSQYDGRWLTYDAPASSVFPLNTCH